MLSKMTKMPNRALYTTARRQRRLKNGLYQGAFFVPDTPLPFQNIPHAAHRLDQTRRTGDILDFFPQVSHVHLDDIRFTQKIIAPYAVENGLAIQHLARMTHKQVEKIIFGRGQFDLAVAAQHLARGGIQLEVAELQDLLLCRTAIVAPAPALATQNRAHPRDQLLEAKRLGQVVVRSGIQSRDAV